MTSPLSPEAVAQMVADLRAADKPLIQSGPFIQTRERLRTAADMLTTLAAQNATLRAEQAMLKFDIDKMLTQIEEHNAAWDELRASEAAALERVAELEAALANPVAVHANMLRGTIANPTPDQIIHLYGVDALCKALAPMIVREALEPTEYERKVAQMKEDFPNGI